MSLGIHQMHMILGDDGDVSLLEIGDIPRMGQHGHDIRRDIRGMLGLAHHQGTSGTSRNQRSGLSLGNNGQRIAASHLFRRRPNRLRQALPFIEIFIDQVRDHFRISFGLKQIPIFFQLLFQRLIIFDNPVVDKHTTF